LVDVERYIFKRLNLTVIGLEGKRQIFCADHCFGSQVFNPCWPR
jgi:hypothetical protein